MTDTPLPRAQDSADNRTHTLRLADLSKRAPTRFSIEPDEAWRASLRDTLELTDLRKLRFSGVLQPVGRADWVLETALGATVVQPCGVTLAPVTTRIEEEGVRKFFADWEEPDGTEVEMPDDDSAGPVPSHIDLAALLEEDLALALPLYPRAEGVSLGEAVFTEPGKAAMTDADARPFAALAKLKAAPDSENE